MQLDCASDLTPHQKQKHILEQRGNSKLIAKSWLEFFPWPFPHPTLWNQFGEEGDYDVTSETLWHTFTLIWSFARNPLKIQIGYINLEKLLLRESWQLSENKTFCKIPIIGCVARVIRQRSIDYCMGQMLQYNLWKKYWKTRAFSKFPISAGSI